MSKEKCKCINVEDRFQWAVDCPIHSPQEPSSGSWEDTMKETINKIANYDKEILKNGLTNSQKENWEEELNKLCTGKSGNMTWVFENSAVKEYVRTLLKQAEEKAISHRTQEIVKIIESYVEEKGEADLNIFERTVLQQMGYDLITTIKALDKNI